MLTRIKPRTDVFLYTSPGIRFCCEGQIATELAELGEAAALSGRMPSKPLADMLFTAKVYAVAGREAV